MILIWHPNGFTGRVIVPPTTGSMHPLTNDEKLLMALQAEIERLREVLDDLHGILLWALYHHQDGSSPVGQPIRRALGIGEHDHMTPEQIELAKGAGSLPFNATLPGAVGIRAE